MRIGWRPGRSAGGSAPDTELLWCLAAAADYGINYCAVLPLPFSIFFDSLSHSRHQAFTPLRLSFYSLYLSSITLSFSPFVLSTFVTYAQAERFIPYRKKLLGRNHAENRFRERSAESKTQIHPRIPYKDTAPLSSYNLRQLPRMTDSTAEIGP